MPTFATYRWAVMEDSTIDSTEIFEIISDLEISLQNKEKEIQKLNGIVKQLVSTNDDANKKNRFIAYKKMLNYIMSTNIYCNFYRKSKIKRIKF